jgi:hypothetical protein
MKKKLKSERKKLLKSIESLWGYEAYSQKVHDELKDISPTDIEANEVKKVFINKNWWEISDEEIETNFSSLFFIGIIPFCYFIPILLYKIIKDFNRQSFAEILINDFFVPPQKEHLRKEFEERKSFFSYNQRKIICEFLIYIKKVYEHKKTEHNSRMVKRISEAIKMWCDCACLMPAVLVHEF